MSKPVGRDARAKTVLSLAAVTEPKRILVVDDNVDAAEMLGEALTMFGHVVQITNDPEEATNAAEAFVPDVVVMDIGMPGLDGYAVATQMHGRGWPRMPLMIALTGYGQPRDRALTAAAGFDEHFVKPVDVRKLVERIARP